MQIGAIGKRIGLSVDAIRFYERHALLPQPPRTEGGFRQYDESDVETLGFIRRVQDLGGYIAFEFAHVAVRAGAEVTVVHRGPRPLPLFDPDLVDQIVKHTRELGADVQLGTEVVGVEKSSGQLIVRASASGQKRALS